MTDTNFITKLRQKDQITTTVSEYEEFFDNKTDSVKRQGQSDVLTNDYYDLVTDFYEYGWTKSFHFAQMFKDSSFMQSITRHEDYLALKLQLNENMVCLDVGCGVGGPMREVAKFSGCKVVGLNNNDYQITRSDYHSKISGLENQCHAVKVLLNYLGGF
jgi:sterol 24-C-methyltransferase